MPFPYKTVLVTGATSGIGRALAGRMIDAGIFVIAVGRNKSRLDELVAQYGSKKVAVENFDVSDLDALSEWCKRITTTYPTLDCIFLNAGFQQTVDFTNPASITLSNLDDEVRTNYLAVIHMITHFLPFLISKNPSPAGIVMVSSSLSLAPQPQTANYCASKAAVHSLAWSLRAQLDGSRKRERKTDHIRVVEVIPPAVKTELHARQGRGEFGMELEDYVRDTWGELAGAADVVEILPAPSRQQGLDRVEDGKRKFFEGFRRTV